MASAKKIKFVKEAHSKKKPKFVILDEENQYAEQISQINNEVLDTNKDLNNSTSLIEVENKFEKLKLSAIQRNPDFILKHGEKKINVYSGLVDYKTRQKLPEQTNILCFWCKHPFNTHPIGIPVKYHPSYVVSSLLSERTGEPVVYKEYITMKERKRLAEEGLDSLKETLVVQEYFETDGNFCSFNCAIAFFRNTNKFLYRESYSLIKRLYYLMTGEHIHYIKEAKPWQLLRPFGGPLSIEEFRDQTIQFKTTGQFKHPLQVPIIPYFEQK